MCASAYWISQHIGIVVLTGLWGLAWACLEILRSGEIFLQFLQKHTSNFCNEHKKLLQQNLWHESHPCFYKRITSQFLEMCFSLNVSQILSNGIAQLVGPIKEIKTEWKILELSKSCEWHLMDREDTKYCFYGLTKLLLLESMHYLQQFFPHIVRKLLLQKLFYFIIEEKYRAYSKLQNVDKSGWQNCNKNETYF